MSHSTEHGQDEKASRLVEYLLQIASLRSKVVRDFKNYDKVLWISDIPQQKGCFTRAWGQDEDFDPDIWIEIQHRREPQLPSVPDQCKDWINGQSLRNKSNFPELPPEISIQLKNPNWQEGSDEPEFISQTECLENHPEVQRVWDRYLEECWLPWTEEHNVWESINKVYSSLFAIHQEQLRLGEEYEMVLGFGLLVWRTPSGQLVRRHMVVANALLEFEARLGKFTVRPMTDGANLRPELDMLEIGEQPARAEEMAKSSLANAGDDPWEKGCMEGVLQALVHSINPKGEYHDAIDRKDVGPSDNPIIKYAPALILRKRSSKGLKETLKRIKKRIDEGETIPPEFRDLAEISSKGDPDLDKDPGYLDKDPGEINSEFDGEVFFPKPSNKEQRRIIDKIQAANGILVQGPPGTGKSHTIANLICHLLAKGQRTLITAKTPRALKVLEGLVPDEVRPLCINLLGSGLEEKRSLETSVNGILRKNEEWDEKRATEMREGFEQALRDLREKKAKVNRRLRDIRESETHSQSIAEGTYRGTTARIAEAINRERSAYEWFTDTAPLDKTCPISESDLRSVLAALRHFTPEKRQELGLEWPENLPSREKFSDILRNEKSANEEETRSRMGADEQVADHLTRTTTNSVKKIRDFLAGFQNERRRLSASPHPWMRDALIDVMSGNSSLWRELHHVTTDIIGSIEKLVPVADETNIHFPDEAGIRTLLEDVCKLKEHLENGGKLGWGPFRSKLVKERIHVLKTVKVSGHSCSNLEQLSVLADALRVRVECEKAWGFWAGRCKKIAGPYALQLTVFKAQCDALGDVLSLEGLIKKGRENIQQCPFLNEPVWAEGSQIDRLIASCRLALARNKKRLVTEEIDSIEAPLAMLASKSTVHPIVSELLGAIHDRDITAYKYAASKVQDLGQERHRLLKVDEYISKMRCFAPKLTEELKHTCNDTHWESRIQHIRDVWHWAQAKFWVEEYIRKEDAPSLSKRVKQIEDKINAIIAKLASLHAWSFCFSRLKESHRRHMEAWQQSMRRLGKGTGKHAPRHRREAQQHLNECREAVPAWVMPLHRVWDTVDPAPGIFDVIIVDEASQCGLEALPLFYLGKKILIVGDDKQISPEAGFVDKNAVFKLMEQFLYDFDHKDSFHRDASLFDHGKLRYDGTQRITLREHFRCMPEIIRFSNDLCYFDTPLIPLRQYGSDRLPPLEHVFVNGGYREGSGNRIVNRPEAEAIVEKIVELCKEAKYSDKTMGVVVLQGDAQAGLIEDQLDKRLGPEEVERRRLVCGNPYSFQGDERDIMFLSMVAAPNERIGPFTKAADERRFNVAASRARDQMWLFHSVTCNDLSTHCLRRRLLEFFENTRTQEIPGIDRETLEQKAFQDNRSIVSPPKPFDSWFEVDVALELARKGFTILPQHEVAGKRIDLVVDGGQARLAVECDGDKWHGPDQYEADMQRQRQLERCGWEFFRVRESAFYSNKERALQGLWQALEERNIMPGSFAKPITSEDENDAQADDLCDEEGGADFEDDHSSQEDSESTNDESSRRPEEVSSSEISDAILHALEKCPNCSCTLHSLTSRVLKELGILTRGNPRMKFERRVMRTLSILENQERIEQYKAKNKRVRLI